MRTTLALDDDVLMAVKDRARRERRTAGEVLSDLARQALTGQVATSPVTSSDAALARLGFHPLPHRGPVTTNEMVTRLREEIGE